MIKGSITFFPSSKGAALVASPTAQHKNGTKDEIWMLKTPRKLNRNILSDVGKK
jgi:hypothetical protein